MYEINYIDWRNNKIKIAESGQLAVGSRQSPPTPLTAYILLLLPKMLTTIALTACMGREGVCEKVGSGVKWASGYN